MHQFKKHFTVKEARAMLPLLRSIFQDAHHRRKRAKESERELSSLLTETASDLGGEKVAGLLMDLVQLNTQLQRLHKLGIQVKDFDRGLIDFPHLRDGREVLLCWELDEADIEFWHDVDAGYAGRERL